MASHPALLLPSSTSEDAIGQAPSLSEPRVDGGGPLSCQGLKSRSGKALELGDFRIMEKKGRGSTGAVYRAYQQSHNRYVALKILGKKLSQRAAFVERFYQEAGLLDRLEHPGLVRCYGVGQEMGFHYFAMEYVEGIDAASLLARLGGQVGLGDALHLILRCAEALDYAWQHKVIHRDVKPHNLLVSSQRDVKLTDLGLAKPTDGDRGLTESHTGMGTPEYMAPEQARSAKRADQRSDIYSLGVTLYQFLTGELPFRGAGLLDGFLAKERGKFRPASRLNSKVPARCDRMLARMLAPSPETRYQGYRELLAELRLLGLKDSQLSFDPMRIPTEPPPVRPGPPLDILLIYDDPSYIPLVEKALRESEVPANLHVVEDSNEALELVRGTPQEALPRPGLILAGLSSPTQTSLEVLHAIPAALAGIPLVALSTLPEIADLLRSWGAWDCLWVASFDDLEPLEDVLHKAHEQVIRTLARNPARLARAEFRAPQ
jgi:serine/threonine protein kinase